ncbi:hypothetical protein BS50DRAFT_642628 [Corynespora cassiicola Philippines]|uniref:F-box domain-containing protein n=1 Tax=Corynespora cassiicola Philippines TaxID=1448308 RepID=A0A2T2P9W0_CORCC|nr:hypothetical protein BS50DRAFT_642628 [Corynespora cassiicola Philippines]
MCSISFVSRKKNRIQQVRNIKPSLVHDNADFVLPSSKEYPSQGRPKSAKCYLLTLPRELRDIIYAYVFSEPCGIYCKYEGHTSFKLYASVEAFSNEDTLEINQMKYTCRILYQETIGLALRYNDIILMRYKTNHPSSIEQVLALLRDIPPKKLEKIQKIEARTHPDLSIAYHSHQDAVLRELQRICTWYPKLRINLRVLGKERIAFVLAPRGLTSLEEFMVDALHYLHWAREMSTASFNVTIRLIGWTELDGPMPRNIRFLPHTSDFDREGFCKKISEGVFFPNRVVPYYVKGIDGLADTVNKWYQEGV